MIRDLPPDPIELLIVEMGAPPDDIYLRFGSQARWFSSALAGLHGPITVLRPSLGEALPAPQRVRRAIISGSWSMVTDREPWSEVTAEWLRQAMTIELPLLGVCYGHQLMAYALGGRVDYHPGGPEIGTHEVSLLAGADTDPMLGCLPSRFRAHLSHFQSVTRLPDGAMRLAISDHDANQIIRYSAHAISTQFHPEFDPALLTACIDRRATTFAAHGRDVAATLAAVTETAEARQILTHFVSAQVPEQSLSVA